MKVKILLMLAVLLVLPVLLVTLFVPRVTANLPPVASFTQSATTVYKQDVILFNGSASYDPDGTIASYFWTFGDGSNATGVSVNHYYAGVGTYTVNLTVTDDAGATASQTAVTTVLDRPPVATFTQSATTVNTSETVFFNASASYDPDGAIVSYSWAFGDGSNATGVTTSHAYINNGIYTVTLTVTDNDATEGTKTSTVTVLDRPPMASFTESATTALTGVTINFNASASYDPDGLITNYFWTFGDGTNASGVTASHAYANNGVYTATLKVTDDDGSTATSSIVITIADRPPVASFTQSMTMAYTGDVVRFNASASYDADGFIVNYFWTFGDGTNATGTVVDHVYTSKGTYMITLAVRDDDNSVTTTTSSIVIQNRPPVAQFTQSATTAYTGVVINFNGSSSYDLDGSIVAYFWTFGDGTNASGAIVTHSYVHSGVFTVALTVTDNDGATNTKTSTVTVLNRPPVASFTTSATTVPTSQTVYFNASASHDPDGWIVSYFWTFGDGTNATGIIVGHSYADNGAYMVTLTVTDNNGAEATASSLITVLDRPPVAAFTASATQVFSGESVTFNATNSYDPDGFILNYFWTFGDGANATGEIVQHSYAKKGAYTVQLLVTDNDGTTATATSVINVQNRLPIASYTYSPSFPIANQAVTFNASTSYDPDGSIVSYKWNFGDGNLTTITVPLIVHTYSVFGNYLVTLNVTDNDGGTNAVSKTVNVRAYPTASLTFSPNNPIVGNVVSFNASASTPNGGVITQYIWNFGDGTPAVNTTTPTTTHVFSTFGNYTVALTVWDSESLSGSTTRIVNVRAYPTASFTFSPSYPIEKQTMTFNASSSTPNGGVITSYQWNFGDGNKTTVTTPLIAHMYSAIGNYTTTLTVTDSEALNNTLSKVVRVIGYPLATFSYKPSVPYVGETVTFNASLSSPNGGAIVDYLWSFGDGTPLLNITNSITTHVYAIAGNYTVILTVKDSEGLSNSTTNTIRVAKAPIAIFTYSPQFPKISEMITFNASQSYDPNGYYIVSYKWNFGDSNITTVTSPTVKHAYPVTGAYTVTLTVTDSGGYTDAVMHTVTMGTPKASFIYTPTYPIAGQPITLNASASYDPDGYIVSYVWNFGDGNATTTTKQIITHAYTTTGNYTAALTVVDNSGLTGTTAQVISVGKAPVASFTYTPTIPYMGGTITFNASSSTPSGGSITSYAWNFGDGSPIQNRTAPTITYVYASAGNYPVSLTIKDSAGRSNTASKTVQVFQSPVAVFTHVPIYPTAFDAVTFNASQSYDKDGYIVSYVWNFGDSNITTMTTPIITHVYKVAGNYSVVLIVTDNQGYADSASESLYVSLRPPVADFTFAPGSPIQSQLVSFNATNSYDLDGIIVSYKWVFGDGNTTTVTTPLITHAFTTYGNFTTALTVTDSDGLANTKAISITARGYPTASFAYTPNIPGIGGTVTFNASSSAPNGGIITNYSWNFGDGSPQLNTPSQIATHTYAISGNYTITLIVTDSEGLSSAKSKTIYVAKWPIASFTFSPVSPYVGDTVTFNASASYDPDGTILRYLWDFGDGSPKVNSTTPVTAHVYVAGANYMVSLTVTDSQSLSATTTKPLTVGKAPIAAFTYSPSFPIVNQVVTFNASASYDPTRAIANYTWSFGDGNVTTVTSNFLIHVYRVEGSYNVSLTVKDIAGYLDTISRIVYVRNYPIASFVYSPSYPIRGLNTTFDASSSQPRGGTILSYLWNFGDGTPLFNATSPITIHVYNAVGQYTVTLKVTNSGGLTATTTATLKVRAYPTATFTYSPTSPIATYSVTFNASLSTAGSGNITGFIWNFGDGIFNTVTTPVVTHVYARAGIYNATLTVTNTDGLESTTARSLTVSDAPPIASFNYSPSFPIVNQSVKFDASASYDPDGAVGYRWSFGDGNTTTVAVAIIYHTYKSPGSFTATLTVTDNAGLIASQTKTVRVGQPPIASYTYSPLAPYVGDSMVFNASQSRDLDGYIVTYSWNFGDGPVLNVTNPVLTHTYSIGGNYTIVLTVVDNGGLPSTTSKSVSVAKAPGAVFTFSPDYPIAGQTITFNASQSYDVRRPIVKYVWVFGGGAQANTTVPTVPYYFTKEGNYTVTLTVSDNAGYSDTIAHVVRIRNYPIASFTVSPTSPIKGQSATFDASSSLPRGGTITGYLWDFGDGTTKVQTSTATAVHTYSAYGNFTVTLTVSDSESLSGSTTKTIIARAYPTASFTTSFPIQCKVPATFDATSSTPNGGTITSYKWDFGDGNITTLSYPVVRHAYATTGIFAVKLTVTDSEALSNTASKGVTVVPASPTASFTYTPQMPLVGQAVTFNASGSYDPDGWIANYTWNFGDGISSSSSTAIMLHTYTKTGFYNVTLTVKDYDGYSNAQTKAVEVFAYPSASFIWSPLNPLVSVSALFNASASAPGSGVMSSYAWSFGDGNVTTMSSPTILHAYGAVGPYTVRLTVTNSKGLSNSLTKYLTVYQAPLADFVWQPTTPKASQAATFNASISSPGGGVITGYRWAFNDGTSTVVSSMSTVTHSFASFGQYTVTLTVTNSEGLSNSKSKTITVIAPPTASFTWSSNPKAYEGIIFNGSSSSANGGVIVNYRWNFGDGNTTNVNGPIVIHTYLVSGNFNVNLTLTDSEGLFGTVVKTINVAAPVAPKASFTFSPSSPYIFQTINFDASASTPGTGSTLNYQWNFGDGNTTSTAVSTIKHVFKTSGNFTVSVTVRNIAGLSNTTSKPATVLPISGPTANFSWSPFVPLANKTVSFDGSTSVSGWNGSIRPPIASWRWNFGDGNTTQVTTATIAHKFALVGNYSITLTVSDINGLTNAATKTVKVSNLIGDLNGDGKVDIRDLAIAAKAYGSSPGMPNWNPIADITGPVQLVPDGKVDIRDIALIAKHYGETVTMSLFEPSIRSVPFGMSNWPIVTVYLLATVLVLTKITRTKRKDVYFEPFQHTIKNLRHHSAL